MNKNNYNQYYALVSFLWNKILGKDTTTFRIIALSFSNNVIAFIKMSQFTDVDLPFSFFPHHFLTYFISIYQINVLNYILNYKYGSLKTPQKKAIVSKYGFFSGTWASDNNHNQLAKPRLPTLEGRLTRYLATLL